MNVSSVVLDIIKNSNEALQEIGGVKYLPYNLMWGRSLQGYRRNSVQVGLHRLVKDGLVKRIVNKDQVYLALTERGKEFFDKKGKDRPTINFARSKTKWDGLYRVIFFDIPEKDRAVRDTLRLALRSAGAVNWQRSVWVTKNNITRELNEFILKNQLDDFISIVEVKDIYNRKLEKLLQEK